MGPARLAVGTGMLAVIEHTLAQPGNEEVRSVNAVVGETNDASLNDIRAHYTLTPAMLRAAIQAAADGTHSQILSLGHDSRNTQAETQPSYR